MVGVCGLRRGVEPGKDGPDIEGAETPLDGGGGAPVPTSILYPSTPTPADLRVITY